MHTRRTTFGLAFLLTAACGDNAAINPSTPDADVGGGDAVDSGTAGPDCGDGEACDAGSGSSDEMWTFVSVPDFLNADIGDVSALTSQVNSTNAYHEAAIAFVLDAIAAENPDFVMVAGDLVNGHWISDYSGVQVFGPVGTRAEKAAAIDVAADLYYGQWLQRFTSRGLTVYAALGDHDVGDNDWPAGGDRAHLVANYKAAWARHFTLDAGGEPLFARRPVGTASEHTAYAVKHKNVLVVTVDEFRQTDPDVNIDSRTGSVRNDVVGEQLAWLETELAKAAADPEIDHVIVQGHVPVLLPVRKQNSSGLTMPGAGGSEFWQALVRHGVDLYFAGEVHDMSTANSGGVEQVVHGGIMGYAINTNYLVGHVYPDRLELELKRVALIRQGDTKLWQAGRNRPRERYSIGPDGFQSVGTLVIDKSSGDTVYRDRTGYFIPLDGGDGGGDGGGGTAGPGLAVHLPFDEPAGSAEADNRGTTGDLNDGQISGATFVTGGKLGNALRFDAADRVPAGPTPVFGARSRTTSVWVQVAPAAGKRTAFTMGKNKSGSKWDIDIDDEGNFELGLGNGRTDGTGTPVLTDNQWHLLVVRVPDGATRLSDIELYVDGERIASALAGNDPLIDTGSGTLTIGHAANSIGFQQLDGSVDDLAIWGRALSAVQIRALWSAASDQALGYDAGDLEAMFAAFAGQTDATVDGRLWRYQASGLTTPEGVVYLAAGAYSLNLGGGAGFVSD